MGELVLLLVIAYAGYRLYIYLTNSQNYGNQQSNRTRGTTALGLMNTDSRRIEETGTMIYYANDIYNLPDKEYRFKYRYVNGTWRAYIIRTPETRNGQYGTPHTLRDGDMRYICWDQKVATLKDMQTISRQWADNVQKYIATGRSF